MPPPKDPGIHDKNSKFDKELSLAKFDIFLSRVAAPAWIVSSFIKFKNENFDPSLIVTPFTPESLIKVLDPAPKIVIFLFIFFTSRKNEDSWATLFGLKKISDGPPRLNQLYLDSISSL